VIGSRDPDRAREKAEEYETELASRGRDAAVGGFANTMAADRANVIVLAVPASEVSAVLGAVEDRSGDAILVSPAVRVRRDEAVAQRIAAEAPDGVPVVGAFHGLSADLLANLDVTLDRDTVVVGDDEDTKETVGLLASAIEGLGTVDAGGLANAPTVESLAALLENVERHTPDLHDVGVTFAQAWERNPV